MEFPPFTPAFTPKMYNELVEPNLIGALLGWGLFGASMLQFYTCFRASTWKKHKFIICFLIFLFLLDVGDQCAKTAHIMLYYRNVVQKGIEGAFVLPPTSLPWQFFTGTITTTIHLFYFRRIIVLTSQSGRLWFSWTFAAVFTGISLLSYAFCLVCGVHPNKQPDVIWWASVYLGGAAAVDIAIALFLLLIFSGMWAKTSFQHTRSLLTKWITLTVETGGVTSVAQIIELALFLPVELRATGYYYALAFIQPKIYVNSGLVLIRTVLTEGRDSSFQDSRKPYGTASGGSLVNSAAPPRAFGVTSAARRPHEAIMVTTNTAYRHDPIEMQSSPRGTAYSSDIMEKEVGVPFQHHHYGGRDDGHAF